MVISESTNQSSNLVRIESLNAQNTEEPQQSDYVSVRLHAFMQWVGKIIHFIFY